jgi:UrcA family protein
MSTLLRTILTFTAAGLFFGFSAQVLSGEYKTLYGFHPSKTVLAADLDAAKPEDVQTLYDRIRSAARIVCRREYSAAWDLKRIFHRQQCFERAVDQTVAEVGVPQLTALHRGEIERVAGL